MTDEIYKQATELRYTKRILEEVYNIMTFPYPELSFSYKSERLNVNFVELDNETRKQLKEAILNVVGKRRQEIVEEFKQL